MHFASLQGMVGKGNARLLSPLDFGGRKRELFTKQQRDSLRQTLLARIIRDNTGIASPTLPAVKTYLPSTSVY